MSGPTPAPAQRNGHRPRLLSTPAADIDLAIPRAPSGRSFSLELLEPRPS